MRTIRVMGAAWISRSIKTQLNSVFLKTKKLQTKTKYEPKYNVIDRSLNVDGNTIIKNRLKFGKQQLTTEIKPRRTTK